MGTGDTLVVNGVIVTNVVLSEARAYVADNADLTATGGDIVVAADNAGADRGDQSLRHHVE